MQIKNKVSYKLILLFLVDVAKDVRSTQNNKFAISLDYLRKEGRDEVDFLHVDINQTFLQVEVIKILKVTSFQIFAISQKWSGVLYANQSC